MDARTPRRDQRIDLRLTREAKRTLQHAAAIKHKTLSEFVIDSSINAAYEAMSERTVFLLNDKQWAAINKELNRPPKPNAGLRRLMKVKPVWER